MQSFHLQGEPCDICGHVVYAETLVTCASMNVCMCCYCILCSDPCFLSKDGPTLFAHMV